MSMSHFIVKTEQNCSLTMTIFNFVVFFFFLLDIGSYCSLILITSSGSWKSWRFTLKLFHYQTQDCSTFVWTHCHPPVLHNGVGCMNVLLLFVTVLKPRLEQSINVIQSTCTTKTLYWKTNQFKKGLVVLLFFASDTKILYINKIAKTYLWKQK